MISRHTRKPGTIGSIWRYWQPAIILLIVVSFFPLTGQAQNQVETLEVLEVRLWPDFDRPSVLTTLVGTLPVGTTSPAEISLPIPEGATIHAVSPLRDDGRPGPETAYDDSVPGEIVFTVEPPGFWVEYYAPYSADGNRRAFTFNWLSDIAVDQLQMVVQQPVLSSDLATDPVSERVITGPDGMQYHELSGQAVPAGTPYTLDGSYSLARNQLSQEVLSTAAAPVTGEGQAGDPEGTGIDWPIVAALAAVLVGVAVIIGLFIASQRRDRRVTKPRPVRRSAPRQVPSRAAPAPPPVGTSKRFCHECGQGLDPGDNFCSNCGTRVKISS